MKLKIKAENVIAINAGLSMAPSSTPYIDMQIEIDSDGVERMLNEIVEFYGEPALINFIKRETPLVS